MKSTIKKIGAINLVGMTIVLTIILPLITSLIIAVIEQTKLNNF